MAEETPEFTPGITGNISDIGSESPADVYSLKDIGSLPSPISSMPAQSVRPAIGSPTQTGLPQIINPNKFNENYTKGLLADFDATEGKNNYAKIYSYDSGPDSNAFYDRYAAFGEEKLLEVGFSPIRDNEANFNANTTWWDNSQRMLSHSFLPLVGLGFKSPLKSMGRMLKGDFNGADLEEAEEYKRLSALGQDSRGGVGSFFNNALMNFGYTAGIMTEAIAEEVALTLGNTMTGGALTGVQAARTVAIAERLRKANKLFQMPKAFKTSLQSMNNLAKTRNFWTQTKTGRFLNPIENTTDAIQGIIKSKKQGEYLTGLAQFSKTAGGLYRDIRNINMAISEARLESGMVINEIYDKGYKEFYNKTGRAPSNEEQRHIRALAEKKGLETFYTNAGLIYLSNKIVFNNITRPRGGLSKFMKNTREEIYTAASKNGEKNFGTLGKIIYDNTKKSFVFEKNNLKNLAKSWWKNPGFKTAKNTIGYFKANFTEGLQENAQEAIARANEEAGLEALRSAVVQSSNYANGVNKWTLNTQSGIAATPWSDYRKELGKEFSAQGLETFATGFLMGTFAGPLNAAIPFLSTQYNRMFNKQEYQKWVETKTEVTEGIVEQLNNINVNDFLSSKVINLGTQDTISRIKDSKDVSTKENFDTDVETFISQVNTMRRTGTTELFIDKLRSMKELTDKELIDAVPGDAKESPEFYRERLDKSITKLETIQKRFDQAEEMFPNPVNVEALDKSNTYEYTSQAILHHAWNKAVENYVFFSESFADTTQRMKSIQETYLSKSEIGQSDYSAARVLFTPEQIGDQKTILRTEIDTEQQKDNPNTKRIAALEAQIKNLDAFDKAFMEFRKFYIRGDFANQARAILQSQKAEGETVTEAEIDAYLDEQLGALDNQDRQVEILTNLKNAHHAYLRSIADGVNATVFDSSLDQAFEDLTDFYKLGEESRSMANAVNVLHDPAGFLELVQKNQQWMKRLYDRRSEYYTKLVNDQISAVEDNAFLNQLASAGLYISAEDFAEYRKNGTAPSEIFDNINKVVYEKGTKQYNKIYKEFFVAREALKDLTVQEAALFSDEIFNAKLKDLNRQYDEKIANLPLEPTRVTLQEFPAEEGKKYKFSELVEALGSDQTLQAVYSETEDPVLFYKDTEGNIRFTDAQGEVVDVEQIDKEFDFLSGEIFNIQELPNQEIVEAINSERRAAIERLTQDYLEGVEIEEVTAKPEEEVVIFSTDTPIDQMPAELRNALFVEFDKTLTPEERDTLTEEQQDNLFDKFVKQGNFTVKKIIDEYNQKEADKRDLKVAGDTKKDFEFQFNGKTISTKDKSVPTLRALQTQLKLRIESLEENPRRTPEQDKELKYFQVQAKNLEGVITARTREGLTPAQIAAIEKIQELKSKQPKYTVDSKGYNIEGKTKPYKRVTSVINQFLKDYTYRDKDKVIEIFNRTLGQDIKAVDAFVDELNAAALAGIEPYTIRELRARLPEALEGAAEMAAMEQAAVLTPQDIEAKKADIEERRKKSFGRNEYGFPSIMFNYSTDSGYTGTYYASDGTKTIIEAPTEKEVRNELKTKYDAELAALGTPDIAEGTTLKTTEERLQDAVVNLVGELTYESSRVTGNYIDEAVKNLFDKGTVPEFNENQISREAYDNLFGPQGYLMELKRRADNGEIYIASTGIVVYDDALGIAGEIDLLVADRKGNITIVDIKTGEASKWKNFFKKNNQYSKLENYGLQQTAYANLLNRMIGVDAKIALLPIEITKSTSENTDGKIETAKKPSAANVLTTEYLISLNKPDFFDRINSVIPIDQVEETENTSLNSKGVENESSNDQDNEAFESASGKPGETVKMSKNELKEFNTFKKRINGATTVEQLNNIGTDISMAIFQQLLPQEAVNELNKIINEKQTALENSETDTTTETLDSIEVGKTFIATNEVVQTKGRNKGDVFAEQYSMVKITKIDGNKITVQNNNGNKMTITLDALNENYRSEESIDQPEKKSTKDNESKGQETISSTTELLSDQEKLDQMNKTGGTVQDIEDDLLDDLEC